MLGRRGLAPLLLTLALLAVGCSHDAVKIAPVEIGPAGGAAGSATAAPKGGTPAPPRPPALARQSFRPADGYTSMAADHKGVYWLGGPDPRHAAVLTAGLAGENERVLARPRQEGEALGRPLPVGDWVAFAETRDTDPAGGPWRIRAVNLLDATERIVDEAGDGWEGLSLAVAGTRLAYTTVQQPGPEGFSEVRLWDSADDSRRVTLRTTPGVTLQRIAFDGGSAAAVRTTRAADGTVATDVVELDLLNGRLTLLPALNATLPAIAPRWIAWVTIPREGGANQLVLYDRERRLTRVVAESGPGRSLFNPSLSGNLLTWNRSDAADLALYDAAQRASFPLDQGVVGKVWLYDNTLVWTALDATTKQYEMQTAIITPP